MADIKRYTDSISAAIYGEEVRGSIVNAIIAINDQVEDDTASARAYAERAKEVGDELAETTEEAKTAVSDAQDALAATEVLDQRITAAEQTRASNEQTRQSNEQTRQQNEARRESAEQGYVAQAKAFAESAENFTKSDYAINAQSWAVGGTGTRMGEDSNNARYWADVAATISVKAGVATFNGRVGNVVAVEGDYEVDQIDYGDETLGHFLEHAVTVNGQTMSLKTALNTLANVLARVDDLGYIDRTESNT